MRTLIIAASAALLPLAACATGGPYRGDRVYVDERGDEWALDRNDRIYRDRDGRYRCRRPDGTTGLIVGGVAGGVLGNLIAPESSETVGTIIGAAGGAVLGRAIERNEVRCRRVR